jgi:hypothetical protein
VAASKNGLFNTPLGSMGVINKAPYHTIQENSSHTTWSRKVDIMLWLQNNKIVIYQGYPKIMESVYCLLSSL